MADNRYDIYKVFNGTFDRNNKLLPSASNYLTPKHQFDYHSMIQDEIENKLTLPTMGEYPLTLAQARLKSIAEQLEKKEKKALSQVIQFPNKEGGQNESGTQASIEAYFDQIRQNISIHSDLTSDLDILRTSKLRKSDKLRLIAGAGSGTKGLPRLSEAAKTVFAAYINTAIIENEVRRILLEINTKGDKEETNQDMLITVDKISFLNPSDITSSNYLLKRNLLFTFPDLPRSFTFHQSDEGYINFLRQCFDPTNPTKLRPMTVNLWDSDNELNYDGQFTVKQTIDSAQAVEEVTEKLSILKEELQKSQVKQRKETQKIDFNSITKAVARETLALLEKETKEIKIKIRDMNKQLKELKQQSGVSISPAIITAYNVAPDYPFGSFTSDNILTQSYSFKKGDLLNLNLIQFAKEVAPNSPARQEQIAYQLLGRHDYVDGQQKLVYPSLGLSDTGVRAIYEVFGSKIMSNAEPSNFIGALGEAVAYELLLKIIQPTGALQNKLQQEQKAIVGQLGQAVYTTGELKIGKQLATDVFFNFLLDEGMAGKESSLGGAGIQVKNSFSEFLTSKRSHNIQFTSGSKSLESLFLEDLGAAAGVTSANTDYLDTIKQKAIALYFVLDKFSSAHFISDDKKGSTPTINPNFLMTSSILVYQLFASLVDRLLDIGFSSAFDEKEGFSAATVKNLFILLESTYLIPASAIVWKAYNQLVDNKGSKFDVTSLRITNNTPVTNMMDTANYTSDFRNLVSLAIGYSFSYDLAKNFSLFQDASIQSLVSGSAI